MNTARVEEPVARLRDAERAVAAARAQAHAAIRAALERGVTQAEIARLTGYSRERLRQIAREAGM